MNEKIVQQKLGYRDFKKLIASEFKINYFDVTHEVIDAVVIYTNHINDNQIQKIDNSTTVLEGSDWIVNIDNIYFDINIEIATWGILGLLLDIYGANGFASYVLGGVGKNGQFINSIDVSSGELCVIDIVKNTYSGCSISEIDKKLSGKTCAHQNIDCLYRNDKYCIISNNQINENILSLSKKNILHKDGDIWII